MTTLKTNTSTKKHFTKLYKLSKTCLCKVLWIVNRVRLFNHQIKTLFSSYLSFLLDSLCLKTLSLKSLIILSFLCFFTLQPAYSTYYHTYSIYTYNTLDVQSVSVSFWQYIHYNLPPIITGMLCLLWSVWIMRLLWKADH